MKNNIQVTDPIGQIVVNFPGASRVFKEFNIDFCCGGDRPLKEALVEKNLSETEVLDALQSEYQQTMERQQAGIDFADMPLADLLAYIVDTHHHYLQRELPIISGEITNVLRAHGGNHAELTDVHRLFHLLKLDLEQHLIKEEESLFPLMHKHWDGHSEAKPEALKVLAETEAEHDGAGDILKELRTITQGFKVPDDGCPTYHSAYSKLAELESDLFQHIHLENNLLFPKFAKS